MAEIISFDELINENEGVNNLDDILEKAFGEGGYGIICIRNIPGFVEAKESVLKQGHQLAHLPKEVLDQLEDEKSLYNAGWSRGREKMGDVPDFQKGSFYFNPLTDAPGTEAERKEFPVSYPCNIWPTKEMPKFEPAAKTLGQLMHKVCVALCQHIDKFIAKRVPSYASNLLETSMENTDKAKGRLLYYYPLKSDQEATQDSWISWHNDSGFLTCLAGDMYVDDVTGEPIACPDPAAGLYVVNRAGQDVKIDIPPDCMAIQIGECVQIISGGVVRATPHCVRGAQGENVARISHPVFIDTKPTFPLSVPAGSSREQVLNSAVSNKVPPLGTRWTRDAQTFGEFLKESFEQYYIFNKSS